VFIGDDTGTVPDIQAQLGVPLTLDATASDHTCGHVATTRLVFTIEQTCSL
jgi:hypothetical protein